MKDRVVFMLTQDLASPSGLGRYFPIAKELAARGIKVHVIAPHANFSELKQRRLVLDGVTVNYVSQMHVSKTGAGTQYFGPLALIWNTVGTTIKLWLTALKLKPRWLVIGKPHPMNSIAALAYRLFRSCKLILDSDDYEAASNYFAHAIYKQIIVYFEDRIPLKVDLNITNTTFMQQRIIQLGVEPERVLYLPNGVDLNRFPVLSQDKVKSFQSKVGLGSGPVIGYIGSMNLANHSVDLLVEAFALMSIKMPELQLLLVGGGKDLDAIRSQVIQLGVEDKVLITGRVPAEEINFYTRICSVTVDPVRDSLAERARCPLKIFEAWAAGIPFVTMDVGDRRLLAGDPPALLLSSSEPKSLASDLLDLLNNENKRSLLKYRMASRYEEISWNNRMNLVFPKVEDLLD